MFLMFQMTLSQTFPWQPDPQSYSDATVQKFYLGQSVRERLYGLMGGIPLCSGMNTTLWNPAAFSNTSL